MEVPGTDIVFQEVTPQMIHNEDRHRWIYRLYREFHRDHGCRPNLLVADVNHMSWAVHDKDVRGILAYCDPELAWFGSVPKFLFGLRVEVLFGYPTHVPLLMAHVPGLPELPRHDNEHARQMVADIALRIATAYTQPKGDDE